MRRREFIAGLGGAAAWPLVARGQQPAMPVIGFLSAASSEGYTERLRAFQLGLQETGYVDGENVAIEYRWAANQTDRLADLTAEFVRRRVAVIATAGGPASAFAARIIAKLRTKRTIRERYGLGWLDRPFCDQAAF